MEVTKKLAEFVHETKLDDLPAEAIEKGKMCILDCLGCAVGGVPEDTSQMILDYIKQYGGKPQASIIGCDFKTDVNYAALANGTIAHALDYDDYHEETVIHATSTCLPAILAVAESRKLSGLELLRALILGVEVGIRLGLGFGRYHYELGWHSTATTGRFTAAAGVASLLNMSVDKIINAFGICGTQASGVRQVFGTMTKPLHAGKCAMDGVLSALLAEKGFTSSKEIIEGELGLFSVLTETPNEGIVLDGLGPKYHLLDICFKPYATCA
ncbi:MAG: MmgE/PrpD family protein [Deltaproteobacteria bacterium]|nr:MmgE/PrpD family protein [Deltaproteobacteria bacterium]